jgi:UDP-N-acetylmuramate: L-alanyl-gamma-D-glutamyl-meso-diaminopimelate ligase
VKIHILGICGTFMGGVALLARELGHEVTGSDTNVYPPMSTQLQARGITVLQGYIPEHLQPAPELVIIGNALSRGNACVEAVLNQGIPYTSGPQWLQEYALADRHVLAVAGTHGKTTTTSMLAWILTQAGLQPGYLIGGVAGNFAGSAALGHPPYFVVEADEYDTAFFDKRSKFIHYRPRTLVINNIEFDHADIFHDIVDIIREFHRLVRIVPAVGRILHRHGDDVTMTVLAKGCWTPTTTFGVDSGDWQVAEAARDYSSFNVCYQGAAVGRVAWDLIGRHNAENALAAVAAAREAGVEADAACATLTGFKNVKRRLERLGEAGGVTVYDDFAHHPTAIRSTLAALRARVGPARILAVLEPRSNTMKMGVHRETLAPALAGADRIFLYRPPGLDWDLQAVADALPGKCKVYGDVAAIIESVAGTAVAGDQVLIMSNGGFEDIHQRLLVRLKEEYG